MADEAHCIGKASSAESYLRHEAVIDAAKRSGALAIHPGYGFLSENAEFAELCRASGIAFIGPSAEALRSMGDKAVARSTMTHARVPVVPGSQKPIYSADEAVGLADKVGFPLLIKPSAGGGGKGMRVVERRPDLVAAFHASQAEAQAAFGSGEVYLERFLRNARHIEFQILADYHGTVLHLGERECSIQRRHQKLIEEAPSPTLDPKLRARMGQAAVRAAKAVDYVGAGTVEFLLDDNRQFYFIEMNTRIQVEHPVTECVTGIDLVKAQIAVASGEKLGLTQRNIRIRGHAIECRINAEDPEHDFMPSPGKIRALALPGGPGVRLDTHVYCGYDVPHHYDSLLGKLVVHAHDRPTAIARMRRALDEVSFDSMKTIIPFLSRILDDHRFKSGDYGTDLVKKLRDDDEHHRLHGFMHKIMESFHLLPDA
jgi:acetyl-CoA carboxylase biotin carboxylase subunit